MDHKIKILIIDDSYLARLEVKLALEHFGFEMLELESAEAFFRAAQKYRDLDLVLLDISLPGIDGITALEMMRDAPLKIDTPVMIVTGRAERRTVERALQAGALDYIIKPITRKELQERVIRVLQLNKYEWPGEEVLLQVRLEAKRAARGKSIFSLVCLQLSEEINPTDMEEVYVAIKDHLREIDSVFLTGNTFIFILPLTDARGAKVVSAKALRQLPEIMAVGIITAIVSYPNDGKDEKILLETIKKGLNGL